MFRNPLEHDIHTSGSKASLVQSGGAQGARDEGMKAKGKKKQSTKLLSNPVVTVGLLSILSISIS